MQHNKLSDQFYEHGDDVMKVWRLGSCENFVGKCSFSDCYRAPFVFCVLVHLSK